MVNNKKSFTMIEVLVTVIIIAILSTLAVPAFRKTIKKSREKLAVSNLKIIMNAEKFYRASYDRYWPCEDFEAINNNMDLDIEDKYFNYEVKTNGKYDFTATATGKNETADKYTIDPEGNVSHP